MSYSQNLEEAAILKACANVEPKRFLDIGAYHPTKLSNTRALYEAGWSGVMIDPSPYAMQDLLEAYGTDNQITLIQAAVGLEYGLRDMYVSKEAVTTGDREHYDTWKDAGRFVGSMFVPHITLGVLFNQLDGGYGFINIDTEGTSIEIALQLLTMTKDIPCICVEHSTPEAPGTVPVRLLTAMSDAGYTLRYPSAENGVWQKMTWEEMHP